MSKHIFLLPKKTMVDLLSNGKTHVDYAYPKPIDIGDEVTLKEYYSGHPGIQPMHMEAIIKTITPFNGSKYNMTRKRFGLNIQLIMF